MRLLRTSLFEWVINARDYVGGLLTLLFNGTDQYVTIPPWSPTTVDFELGTTFTYKADCIGATCVLITDSNSTERLIKNSSDQIQYSFIDDTATTRFLMSSVTLVAGTQYEIKISGESGQVTIDINGVTDSIPRTIDPAAMQYSVLFANDSGTSSFSSGIPRGTFFTDLADLENSRNYKWNKCSSRQENSLSAPVPILLTNPSDWVLTNATISFNNGKIRVTNTAASQGVARLPLNQSVGDMIRGEIGAATGVGEAWLSNPFTPFAENSSPVYVALTNTGNFNIRSNGTSIGDFVEYDLADIVVDRATDADIVNFSTDMCSGKLSVAEHVRGLLRRNFIDTGSLVEPTAASAPLITLGGGSPTLGGSTISKDDSRLLYYGGNEVSAYDSTFPRNLFETAFNLSFSEEERTAIGAIVEFQLSCPEFEILNYGQGNASAFRLIVDGEVAGTYDGGTPDGSVKWLKVDFTAIDPGAVSRHIRIEYASRSTFGGLTLDTIGLLESAPTSTSSQPSIVFLGDSFTEGVGVSSPELTHQAYDPRAAKLIGSNNYAMSGFGGAGYEKPLDPGFGSVRPALVDRAVYDAAAYDVVVVAMGINDTAVDITDEINRTYDTIRSVSPSAMVYVLGVWGNGSGGNPKPDVETKIVSAVGSRDGFKYIEVYTENFTKSDATHPDDAGHVTLGDFVANQIKADLGL